MQVLTSGEKTNLVVCPWSLTSALIMLYEGTDGNTASEIRNIMSLPDDKRTIRSGYKQIVARMMVSIA